VPHHHPIKICHISTPLTSSVTSTCIVKNLFNNLSHSYNIHFKFCLHCCVLCDEMKNWDFTCNYFQEFFKNMIYLTHGFCAITSAKKVLTVQCIVALNLHRSCLATKSTMWASFISWPSLVCVNPTGIVSFLSPPQWHLSTDRCFHIGNAKKKFMKP
jgi:hypothetical protein